jgi:hypothetical protein
MKGSRKFFCRRWIHATLSAGIGNPGYRYSWPAILLPADQWWAETPDPPTRGLKPALPSLYFNQQSSIRNQQFLSSRGIAGGLKPRPTGNGRRRGGRRYRSNGGQRRPPHRVNGGHSGPPHGDHRPWANELSVQGGLWDPPAPHKKTPPSCDSGILYIVRNQTGKFFLVAAGKPRCTFCMFLARCQELRQRNASKAGFH